MIIKCPIHKIRYERTNFDKYAFFLRNVKKGVDKSEILSIFTSVVHDMINEHGILKTNVVVVEAFIVDVWTT
jgi:hypothetical protein